MKRNTEHILTTEVGSLVRPMQIRDVMDAKERQAHVYRPASRDCSGCPQKKTCTRGAYRKFSVNWYESARQTVRQSAKTEGHQRSRWQRYMVERLFGELKTQINLRRLRLGRLRGATEQFLMAATAQN